MRRTPEDIARLRVIDRIDISGNKGVIVANGITFHIQFDDVLDLTQAVEVVMLKLTGKVLHAKFRPPIKDRKALKHDALVAGDYSLYTSGVAPLPSFSTCSVTGMLLRTHYLVVTIGGVKWENWFCRLDELVKALYIVIREAQADPHVPAPAAVPVHVKQTHFIGSPAVH